MLPIYQFMKDSIPADHCRQSRAIEIALTMAEASRPKLIVDLGCGRGKTVDAFRRYSPESRWVGIDIEESPEVSQRSRDDAEFMTFDGINIPFGDGEVDFIYSNQVLEHVRHPELLLRDIRRVLAPGGVFVGQTSHLEPYHSYSLWNFTIYGFKQICEDAGLTVSELRPGIDGVTLVQRTQAGRPPNSPAGSQRNHPSIVRSRQRRQKTIGTPAL